MASGVVFGGQSWGIRHALGPWVSQSLAEPQSPHLQNWDTASFRHVSSVHQLFQPCPPHSAPSPPPAAQPVTSSSSSPTSGPHSAHPSAVTPVSSWAWSTLRAFALPVTYACIAPPLVSPLLPPSFQPLLCEAYPNPQFNTATLPPPSPIFLLLFFL